MTLAEFYQYQEAINKYTDYPLVEKLVSILNTLSEEKRYKYDELTYSFAGFPAYRITDTATDISYDDITEERINKDLLILFINMLYLHMVEGGMITEN